MSGDRYLIDDGEIAGLAPEFIEPATNNGLTIVFVRHYFPFVRTDAIFFWQLLYAVPGHVLTQERTGKTPFHDFKFRRVRSQITTSGEMIAVAVSSDGSPPQRRLPLSNNREKTISSLN
jgi:hypothetical protein